MDVANSEKLSCWKSVGYDHNRLREAEFSHMAVPLHFSDNRGYRGGAGGAGGRCLTGVA